MKFKLKNTSTGVRKRNKGAISLEYILVIVVVVLACLVGMKVFGGKIGETINNSKDAVVNTTDSVFNRLGGTASGGSGGSGSTGGAEADGSVVISEANFPDATFRTYVATNFDTDGDGKLASDERNAVTSMDASDMGITSLQGVEYFESLTGLDCQGNQLTTLNISSNTALKRLYCQNNQLTSLDVSNNTALELIFGRNNQLTTLDLTNNPSLKSSNVIVDDGVVVTYASAGVDMTSINVTDGSKVLAAGDFSTKGNLVTINDTQYRVLSVDGTQVKVLSMGYKRSHWDSTGSNNYPSSTLDKAMTDFYNTLPSDIQNAIVEQNIKQSAYKPNTGTDDLASFSSWYKDSFTVSDTSGNNYYLTRTTERSVGNRKVFALDVDDMISYLGPNSTPQDINELFFNQRTSVSSYVWLRSANTSFSNYGFPFCVEGKTGRVKSKQGSSYEYGVRPAFVIDLSLLS